MGNKRFHFLSWIVDPTPDAFHHCVVGCEFKEGAIPAEGSERLIKIRSTNRTDSDAELIYSHCCQANEVVIVKGGTAAPVRAYSGRMYWAGDRGVSHSLIIAAVFVGLIAVTSCTSTTPVTKTPSVEASPTNGSEITPVNAALAQTLECEGAIRTAATLADVAPNLIAGEVMAITGGAPGSVTDPIQWGGGASYQGFQFAKVGLAIKTGVKFNIIVPPTWRNRMRIGWGNNGYTLATTLQVPGCSYTPDGAKWLVYPGGFWLTAAACVPLTIETTTGTRSIHVPIGKSCP